MVRRISHARRYARDTRIDTTGEGGIQIEYRNVVSTILSRIEELHAVRMPREDGMSIARGGIASDRVRLGPAGLRHAAKIVGS